MSKRSATESNRHSPDALCYLDTRERAAYTDNIIYT